MRYAVLTAALVGCYSPSFSDCTVSCPSGACPSGLECDSDGMCREHGYDRTCAAVLGDAGGDGSADDLDGDRVTNALDNCPNDANPDQHDEDGDMVGDVCDLCPIRSSILDPIADLDPDLDGVGNACDPNPNAGGDQMLVFDGFASSTTGNQSGPFTFEEDARVAAIGSYATLSWTPSGYNAAQDNVRVATVVTFSMFDAQSANFVWGGGAGSFAAPTEGIACEAGLSAGSSGGFVVQLDPSGDMPLGLQQGPLGTGVPVEIVWSRAKDGSFSCAVMPPNQNLMPIAPTTSGTPAATQLGLHVSGAAASFAWIYIVKSP